VSAHCLLLVALCDVHELAPLPPCRRIEDMTSAPRLFFSVQRAEAVIWSFFSFPFLITPARGVDAVSRGGVHRFPPSRQPRPLSFPPPTGHDVGGSTRGLA